METSELLCFSDTLVNSIFMINNKLYCTQLSDEDTIRQYEILSDGSMVESEYVYCGLYKNYLVIYQQGVNRLPQLCLLNYKNGEIIPIVDNDVYITELSVYKDTLYYRYFFSIDEADKNIGNLCSINLLTGEQNVYSIESLLGHSHSLSYNFLNDKLYVIGNKMIAEIDLESDAGNKYSDFQIDDSIIYGNQTEDCLYSDGERLYIVTIDSDGLSRIVSFSQLSEITRTA